MSEIKLKQCPFCGEHAEFVQKAITKDIRLGFIRCTECGMKLNQENCTEDFAIDLWNTRKPVEKVVEQLGNIAFERYNTDGMGGEKVVNLDDVIEIVKGGGVNDD